MKATVELEDELVDNAVELTGIAETSALLNRALKILLHFEASRRLAELGGTMPGIQDIPRGRIV